MNMQQMMMQAQKMQRELKKAQDALKAQEFSVTKGGAVTVTMYGSKQIKKIDIDEDAFDKDNKDMVEDMIALAVNELVDQITAAEEEINEKITGRSGGLF